MLKGHLKDSLELSGAIRDVMTPKGTRFPRQLASSQRSFPSNALKTPSAGRTRPGFFQDN